MVSQRVRAGGMRCLMKIILLVQFWNTTWNHCAGGESFHKPIDMVISCICLSKQMVLSTIKFGEGNEISGNISTSSNYISYLRTEAARTIYCKHQAGGSSFMWLTQLFTADCASAVFGGAEMSTEPHIRYLCRCLEFIQACIINLNTVGEFYNIQNSTRFRKLIWCASK